MLSRRRPRYTASQLRPLLTRRTCSWRLALEAPASFGVYLRRTMHDSSAFQSTAAGCLTRLCRRVPSGSQRLVFATTSLPSAASRASSYTKRVHRDKAWPHGPRCGPAVPRASFFLFAGRQTHFSSPQCLCRTDVFSCGTGRRQQVRKAARCPNSPVGLSIHGMCTGSNGACRAIDKIISTSWLSQPRTVWPVCMRQSWMNLLF